MYLGKVRVLQGEPGQLRGARHAEPRRCRSRTELRNANLEQGSFNAKLPKSLVHSDTASIH